MTTGLFVNLNSWNYRYFCLHTSPNNNKKIFASPRFLEIVTMISSRYARLYSSPQATTENQFLRIMWNGEVLSRIIIIIIVTSYIIIITAIILIMWNGEVLSKIIIVLNITTNIIVRTIIIITIIIIIIISCETKRCWGAWDWPSRQPAPWTSPTFQWTPRSNTFQILPNTFQRTPNSHTF